MLLCSVSETHSRRYMARSAWRASLYTAGPLRTINEDETECRPIRNSAHPRASSASISRTKALFPNPRCKVQTQRRFHRARHVYKADSCPNVRPCAGLAPQCPPPTNNDIQNVSRETSNLFTQAKIEKLHLADFPRQSDQPKASSARIRMGKFFLTISY